MQPDLNPGLDLRTGRLEYRLLVPHHEPHDFVGHVEGDEPVRPEHRCSLAILDGFDLAQRLKRSLAPHAPKFVAITGYGQPSDRARSKQAGFDEHLVKPIDLARLNTIVRSVRPSALPGVDGK